MAGARDSRFSSAASTGLTCRLEQFRGWRRELRGLVQRLEPWACYLLGSFVSQWLAPLTSFSHRLLRIDCPND